MPQTKQRRSLQNAVEPYPTLATACVVQTIQTGQALLERVQQVCRQFGLTLSTANALAIIDGAAEPLSPCEIQQRLLVSGGAVTQILDALEQHGLVQRVANPNDRRSKLIEITPAGHALREESEPYLNRQDVLWMAALQPEEQIQLASMLAKVYAHLTESKSDQA